MKSSALLVVLGLMAVAVGCSSISVNYDYDSEANFASYQTYAWVEQEQSPTGSDLLDKRIRGAVDTQLAAKGFRQESTNPDILVVFHVGTQDKIDVTDWGYTYQRYGYGGWGGGRQVDVYQYTEGTVIVDLIDAGSSQLVWRGSATKTIDSNPSPERMEKNINDAMAQVFKRYPPK